MCMLCRCFVGNPQQMYSALIGKLAKLPEETQVYCGHEYTLSNLSFAAKAGALHPLLDAMGMKQICSFATGACEVITKTAICVQLKAKCVYATDSENQAVKDKLAWAQKQRDAGKFTIPSTIKVGLRDTTAKTCHNCLPSQPGASLPHACQAGCLCLPGKGGSLAGMGWGWLVRRNWRRMCS